MVALDRGRFTSTKLEEEREKADIVSVRLNREEREMLDAAKGDLDTSADSTALKLMLKQRYGYVIHTRKLVDDHLRRTLGEKE